MGESWEVWLEKNDSRSCANLSIMPIPFRRTSSNGSRTQSSHRRRLYSPHRRVARRSMSAAWACRPCSELVSMHSKVDVHQTRHCARGVWQSSTFSDPRGRLRAAQSPATNDQAASLYWPAVDRPFAVADRDANRVSILDGARQNLLASGSEPKLALDNAF